MRRHRLRSLLMSGLALGLAAAVAAPAAAATGPAWQIVGLTNTTVAPGGTTHLLVETRNAGDADMDASSEQMTLTVGFPAGLQATAAQILPGADLTWSCIGFPTARLSCSDSSDVVLPLQSALVDITVSASPALLPGSAQTISLGVSGGGATADSTVVTVVVSSAAPGFGVATLDGQITADAAGTPSTQAGGHPYAAAVSLDLNTYQSPAPAKGTGWPVEPLRDTYVDLPPGLVGDPSTVAQCTAPELANSSDLTELPLCPSSSQVGTAIIRMNGSTLLGYALGPIPVFNMVPPANVPARFGFNILGSIVTLDARVRSGSDYGVSIAVTNAPEAIPLAGTTVSLWGTPADRAHDLERACPGSEAPWINGPTCTSGAPVTAFLRNPTSCAAPAGSPVQDGLVTAIHIDSWLHHGRLGADGLPDLTDPAWESGSFVSHLPPAYPSAPGDWGAHQLPTGCASVPFDPSLSGQPSANAKPGAPAGFSFDVSLPQSNAPGGIGESDLRSAAVTLPAGVRVSPSSANGLAACTSAQIDLHGGGEPSCPDASKIGTVRIRTPLLPDPLEGAVYLAAQGDNPFGSLLAIYLVARGPGVVLKLAGHVQADPVTGQLSTTFDDNPQLPFSRLHLEFDGGPHAPLTLPQQCGRYTTNATLTGWSGKVVHTTSTFSVSGDAVECSTAVFSPGFLAGTENPVAGASSTFDLRLVRGDRDQELEALTVRMPSGLTGRIARVELCGVAQARDGTCPEGSRVGSVTVGAGAGSDPFYVTGGRAYLTGPYRGAPFGLSIVVPAKAGPFDLGTVVVRSALFVGKHTANVRVVSDPLPTILQGIPLDVRDVRVSIDRRGFFLNATSCAQKAIRATFASTGGMTATASTRYQASDCASLRFRPRMVLRVGGRGHTARGRTTPLVTTLRMPRRRQANLRFVRVTLPSTINARLTVINDACSREQFESDIAKCAHARAGSARAVTPLLRAPLKGSVYFVKNGHPIPDLFVALRGQVAFDLIGRVSIPGGTRLATTFKRAPDVPIRSFSLRLFGDPGNGSIGAAANLCSASSRRAKAEIDYVAQNGRVLKRAERLVVEGCARQATSRRGGR